MKNVWKIILPVCFIGFLLIGCGGGHTTAIELNNGAKWTVNEEMKPFILQSEQMLNDYAASGDTDYKDLAVRLKEKNTALVKSCTMTGKSHEELHKWLHPYIEQLNELGNAPTQEDAAKIVEQMKASFQTFHTYFK